MISDPNPGPGSGLVARTAELAALDAAYRRSLTAGPTTVLIGGEAGIGKSRLVAEFTDRQAARARTVVGGCLPLGAEGLPYAPFVAVLRRLVRALGAETLTGGLADGGRGGLAQWLPELRATAAAPGSDLAAGRARLFDDVLTVLERAAEPQPLIIVLEDLHWADTSSLELLAFLVRTLTPPGILLLCTYRSTELTPDHPLHPLLTSLARIPGVLRVDPSPLKPAELAQLLTDRLGRIPTPRTVEEIHRRSGGNPLFAEALADAGPGTPTLLRDLLLAPVRELPGPVQQAVRAVAVAGSPAGHLLLSAVTGLDGPELEALLRPALARQVLVTAHDGYAFRHALIGAAVYEDLLPGERTRLHLACARELDVRPALVPFGCAPAQLAAHWYAAGATEQALLAAHRAARAAEAGYAHAERLRMLERVLELWPQVPGADALLGADRAAVLHAAAGACLDAGEAGRGLALATEALAATDAPEHRALMLETRSLLTHRQGGDGLDDLRAAVRLIPAPESQSEAPAPLERVRGRLLATLASRLEVLSRDPEAAELATEALRLGRSAGDRTVQAVALVTLASRSSHAGDTAAALELAREAAELATAAGENDVLLLAVIMETGALEAAGAHQQAAAAARHGLAAGGRAGLGRARGAVLAAALAESLTALGRWAEARQVLDDALTLDPPPLYRAILLTRLGFLAVAMGERAEARARVSTARELLDSRYTGRQFSFPLQELRFLLAADEPPADAPTDSAADPAGRLLDELLADPGLTAHPSLSWPALTAAARLVRARLLLAARARSPWTARAEALQRAAATLPVIGPLQDAHRLTVAAELSHSSWDLAADAWRALAQPHQLAHALLRAAEAAHAAGDRPGATARLTEATALATALGATPLAEQTAQLAARARLSPAPAGSGSSAVKLTPRETEVLRLVAEGLSNRQIADQLFISTKTAGVHVSNILAKLHASSRTEAAALAHRLALLTPPDSR